MLGVFVLKCVQGKIVSHFNIPAVLEYWVKTYLTASGLSSMLKVR